MNFNKVQSVHCETCCLLNLFVTSCRQSYIFSNVMAVISNELERT